MRAHNVSFSLHFDVPNFFLRLNADTWRHAWPTLTALPLSRGLPPFNWLSHTTGQQALSSPGHVVAGQGRSRRLRPGGRGLFIFSWILPSGLPTLKVLFQNRPPVNISPISAALRQFFFPLWILASESAHFSLFSSATLPLIFKHFSNNDLNISFFWK